MFISKDVSRKISADKLRADASVKFQSKCSDRKKQAEQLRVETILANNGLSTVPVSTDKTERKAITKTNFHDLSVLSTEAKKFYDAHAKNIGKIGFSDIGLKLDTDLHFASLDLMSGTYTMTEIKEKYKVTMYILNTYLKCLGYTVTKDAEGYFHYSN